MQGERKKRKILSFLVFTAGHAMHKADSVGYSFALRAEWTHLLLGAGFGKLVRE